MADNHIHSLCKKLVPGEYFNARLDAIKAIPPERRDRQTIYAACWAMMDALVLYYEDNYLCGAPGYTNFTLRDKQAMTRKLLEYIQRIL